MTKEQLDNWFSYHAPTDETQPKYAAIHAAERAFVFNVTETANKSWPDVQRLYREINRRACYMAEVIDANAPDSADKTAAIRCVRLAHNLFNEWATNRSTILFSAAELELVKARMQAKSAIACGGK